MTNKNLEKLFQSAAILLSIFDDIRGFVRDLGFKYKSFYHYVGSDTIKISFIEIEDFDFKIFAHHLKTAYPYFKIGTGNKEGTVTVYLKGPGNKSKYKDCLT